MLALAGGVAGSILGFFAQLGLSWLMRDMIGQDLPMPGMQPALLGLVILLLVSFSVTGAIECSQGGEAKD